MKFLKAIRYSGIGVFSAGILGVIQACSLKQEGAGLVFLLFILQLCSGPAVEENTTMISVCVSGATTTCIIDSFDEEQTGLSTDCGTFQADQVSGSLMYGSREITLRNIGGGETRNFEIKDGSLSQTSTGPGCNIVIGYPTLSAGFGGAAMDLTAFSKIEIDYGPSTMTSFCSAYFRIDGSVAEVFNVPFDPTSGTVVGDLTSPDFVFGVVDYSAIKRIEIRCPDNTLLPGGLITIDEIRLVP